MSYEELVKRYVELKDKLAEIDAIAKRYKEPVMRELAEIEAKIALKAQEDGLSRIPTSYGTAYWSTHYSATVADPAVFKEYVQENQAWELLEMRASKTGVKSFIEGHGYAPPGVNFAATKVFNIRRNTKE